MWSKNQRQGPWLEGSVVQGETEAEAQAGRSVPHPGHLSGCQLQLSPAEGHQGRARCGCGEGAAEVGSAPDPEGRPPWPLPLTSISPTCRRSCSHSVSSSSCRCRDILPSGEMGRVPLPQHGGCRAAWTRAVP